MNFLIPLEQELRESEGWLVDSGFHIVRSSFNPRLMGTGDVELESTALRIRFVRDPLTVYAEVAPKATEDNWWELSLVLEAISGARPGYGGKELHNATTLLRDNVPVLTEALGTRWPETHGALQRIYQSKLRETTGRPYNLLSSLKFICLRWKRSTFFVCFALVLAVIIWIVSR